MHTSCIHGGFYGQPDPGGLPAPYPRIPLVQELLADLDPPLSLYRAVAQHGRYQPI